MQVQMDDVLALYNEISKMIETPGCSPQPLFRLCKSRIKREHNQKTSIKEDIEQYNELLEYIGNDNAFAIAKLNPHHW